MFIDRFLQQVTTDNRAGGWCIWVTIDAAPGAYPRDN